MLGRAGLYWRTLRHLRPTQWVGRARLMLPRRSVSAFEMAPARRTPEGHWVEPVALTSAMRGPAAFRFIGYDGALPETGGWDDPAVEKLWRYNLHYFADLTAAGWTDRRAWHRGLVGRWRAENPVGIGTAWEPYPTSLRIVNWIKRDLAAPFLDDGDRASLATQARSLAGRIEWHLFGNHLFANAKALVFAGAFFRGAEADRWLQTGLAIIARELPEQVLADGGNFELSPMYHAIFAEDLLDLMNLAALWPETIPGHLLAQIREAVARMLDWASALTFPDGDIALFNDAATGIAPTTAQLIAYADRLGTKPAPERHGVRHLAESGYVRAESGDAVLIADVARIGPDYLPGHAHADTLSFELALGTRRLIVNGGTSRYGVGPRRAFERSTAAHSTVEVGGRSSSEMWGGFRVGARAYPFDVAVEDRHGVVTLDASHDGYRQLPGKPVHRRRWTLREGGLTVEDTVSGGASALARFILAPDVAVEEEGHNAFRLGVGDRVCKVVVATGTATVGPATYSPHFGEPVATQALEIVLADGRSHVAIDWGMP